MIRLLLYSQDKKLPLLLGPTLGNEFEVALESNPEKVKELVRNQPSSGARAAPVSWV